MCVLIFCEHYTIECYQCQNSNAYYEGVNLCDEGVNLCHEGVSLCLRVSMYFMRVS